MANLKIGQDTDFYRTPIIVEAESGKRVRFEAAEVAGKGWTVDMVIGSRRTGRTLVRAPGFEEVDGYTMHQAQEAAAALTRDTFRSLSAEHEGQDGPAGADTPKQRLLAAIAFKDKSLEAALAATNPDSQEAVGALTEARTLLKKLGDVVERDAATEAVRQVFSELKANGLPVEELNADLALLDGEERAVEPSASQEQEDSIRQAVPTSGLANPSPAGAKKAAVRADAGVDAIQEAVPSQGRGTAIEPNRPVDRAPATLFNGKFIRNEEGEYRRVNEERVALVDEDVRIRFVDKQMDTFQAAIELAASKGWGAIEVSGSDKFRAEAWMHASLAGLEVQGYEPSEKDKARLDQEKGRLTGAGAVNMVESSLSRAEAIARMNYGTVEAPLEVGRYTGPITHETPFHVVQNHGKNTAVIHEKKVLGHEELRKALEDGAELRVEYKKGGIVQTKAKNIEKSKGLER